jgi:hypothetical protein
VCPWQPLRAILRATRALALNAPRTCLWPLRRTDPWCWHAIIIPGLVGLRVLALKLEFCTKRIAPAAAGRKSPHDYIGAAKPVSNFCVIPGNHPQYPMVKVPVRRHGEIATPVPRTGCTRFCAVPILAGRADSTRLPTA